MVVKGEKIENAAENLGINIHTAKTIMRLFRTENKTTKTKKIPTKLFLRTQRNHLRKTQKNEDPNNFTDPSNLLQNSINANNMVTFILNF